MYILGIDTETTGLGAQAKVIELAAIKVNVNTFETEDSLVVRINPGIPISEGATIIHGITDADVADCPSIEQIFAETDFLKWVEGASAVFGHNVKFDIEKLGVDLFKDKARLDTLFLSRQQFRGWLNHKLQTAVSQLGLESRQAHAALGDIESTADILRYFNQNLGYSIKDFKKFVVVPSKEAEQKLDKEIEQNEELEKQALENIKS